MQLRPKLSEIDRCWATDLRILQEPNSQQLWPWYLPKIYLKMSGWAPLNTNASKPLMAGDRAPNCNTAPRLCHLALNPPPATCCSCLFAKSPGTCPVGLPQAGDEEEDQCTEKHHGIVDDWGIFPSLLVLPAGRLKVGDSGRYQWKVETQISSQRL